MIEIKLNFCQFNKMKTKYIKKCRNRFKELFSV